VPIRRLSLLLLLISFPAAAERSPAAQSAYERALRAQAENRLPDAQAGYQEALTLSPGDADSEVGLGSVLFKLGKPDEAVLHFQAATRAAPENKQAWFNLGFVQRKTGNYGGAVESYDRYVRLAPEEADGHYGLAESQRLAGRKAEAITSYEKYLSLEKRAGQEKFRARATEQLTALKSVAAAPVEAAPAAAPSPSSGNVLNPGAGGIGAGGLVSAGAATAVKPAPSAVETAATGTAAAETAAAGALGAPGLGGPAVSPVRETTQTPPPTLTAAEPAPTNSALAREKLAEGDALFAQKRYREASFAYQDAVNADGNDVAALFKLGRSYAVLGYYQQAIDRWRRVMLLSPDPSVRKSADDQIKKAEAKLVTQGGGSPQAQGLPAGAGPVSESARVSAVRLYEEGVKRVMARDYGGALDQLTEAIKLEPNLGVAWIARGSANIGLRRYSEAIADYEQALQLDPNRASPLYGIAEANRGLRRFTEARTYFQRYAAATAPDVQPSLQAEARKKSDKMR
jgi:tetratricopeptide (TPR) repeat protein